MRCQNPTHETSPARRSAASEHERRHPEEGYRRLRATKTYRRRHVEIIRPLARDLERARGQPDELVGGPRDIRNWRSRVFAPAAEAAKVSASPADGRHTYASLMLGSGVNPLLVAAQMGHSTPETTYSRYAHVIAEAAPGIPITEAIERARRTVRRLRAV